MSQAAPPTVANPFVGPRSFETGEHLFGRDRETRELFGLLVSERIVLLHSPSGAGKTSLLQASLVPILRDEGFLVWPPIRVNAEPTADDLADGVARPNRHLISVLKSLEKGLPAERAIPPESCRTLTLHSFFEDWAPAGLSADQVLIFDQFEEILTVAPNDLGAKQLFFDQVGSLLRATSLHAIFSMRGEYVGDVESYRRRIPRALETQFRLDLLGEAAAREAIVGPSRESGVPITEGAASILVNNLRAGRVRRGGQVVEQLGPHVEPVQLQVVCYRLWEKHRGTRLIDETFVASESGDVDLALAEYYADRIARIGAGRGISERKLRDWCEQRLITPRGTRGQVQAGDESDQGLPDRAIAALIDARLVRAEDRRGMTWYELAHDRLIEPLRSDNDSWRKRHLSPTQQRALLWGTSGRPESLLLKDLELAEAGRWADGSTEPLTALEEEFLNGSRQAEQRRRETARQQRQRLITWGLAVFVVIVGVLGGIAVHQWFRAERLSALLRIERGLSYCEQGEISPGLLWLARSLKAIPTKDEDLVRALRMQLSSWRHQLHELRERLPHERPVWAVAFGPDGKLALTGCDDGRARLWDAANGGLTATLKHGDTLADAGSVRSVAFGSDGKAVLTGSDNGTAQLWDATTGKPLGPLLRLEHPKASIRAVALGPDGKSAMIGGDDGTARLWDATTGKPIGPPLEPHLRPVWAVALGPDNRTVLTGSDDGTAQLWDAAAGRLIARLKHQGPVKAVALGPDGKVALTGSDDATARLWDVATGGPIGQPLKHRGSVRAVALGPDGKVALTGSHDWTARLWDVATGEPIGQPLVHGSAIHAVTFGAHGKVALTGSDDRAARLWDATTGKPIGAPLEHPGPVWAVALAPDAQTALTGCEDGTARLWNTSTARPSLPRFPLEHPAPVWAVALGLDGKVALTGCEDGAARLWNTSTGKPLVPTSTLIHGGAIRSVALGLDNGLALTGNFYNSAWLWNAATSKIDSKLVHPGPVWAVALGPDGKVALTGCEDGMARLWDPATGSPSSPRFLLEHQGPVWAVALGAGGKVAFTGSDDRTAQLWDVTTGKPIGPRMKHGGSIRAVALGPDAKIALTGSWDGTARLWAVATGKPIGKPLEHRGPVWAVALGPDGRVALTGCEDGTARLWDVATGQPIGARLEHQRSVSAVALGPDGRTALTGSSDNRAHLWEVPAPMKGSTERIILWTQVVTGRELDDVGEIRFLDHPTWRRYRQRMQGLGGPPPF